MTLKPANLPEWASNPPAAQNEKQTVPFSGTPVSGKYNLNIGGTPTADIQWNDNAATVQAAINAIYGPATAVVTGGPAPTSFVVDFGIASQTSLVPQMTVTGNTMVTAGSAPVNVNPFISQAGLLPATVATDGGHATDGWHFLEKPAFNLFNYWMNLIFKWISYFDLGSASIYGGVAVGTDNIALTIPGFDPTQIINTDPGTKICFIAAGPNANPSPQIFINGSANHLVIVGKYNGTAPAGIIRRPDQLVTVTVAPGASAMMDGDEAELAPTFWCGLNAGTNNGLSFTNATSEQLNGYWVTGNNPPLEFPGTTILFEVGAANTGAVTISIVGNSNLNLLTSAGAALVGGELQAGTVYRAVYDGSHYRLM